MRMNESEILGKINGREKTIQRYQEMGFMLNSVDDENFVLDAHIFDGGVRVKTIKNGANKHIFGEFIVNQIAQLKADKANLIVELEKERCRVRDNEY